ncbi:MAG: threonine synthase [Clostridia bacterium]|nr:threonine synthase [Clostridia bacterium]
MNYVSTRNNDIKVSSAFAIAHGISVEGGLYVPESIPQLDTKDFANLSELDYIGKAEYILKKYLTDFTDEEISACVNGAYTGSFDDDKPAALAQLGDKINILELWHGPTCAFKDLALQLLPYLLTTSTKKAADGKKTVILVATSGDTGKAALEGFKDVENTEIIVFYPSEGVSPMQKLQMDSQKGNNVHVCAIKGNFDDAQSGVKKIFTDAAIKETLAQNGMEFSSANSINWGRLVPQIIYYISAYCDMLAKGDDLSNGFNIVVPTGNFGNILAAYYAKEMGVPVNKLICASNANRVLTDFINTGVYDRNREFYTTMSPSMDILISSNLERMLYILADGDDKYIADIQSQLANDGKFTVNDTVLAKLQSLFFGACCDDDGTLKTIKNTFDEYGYLCDTHTAVAVNAYEQYIEKTGDNRPVLIASTASPYKFAKSVLSALSNDIPESEFDTVDALSDLTRTTVPTPLAELKNATARFKDIYKKEDMYTAVCNCLKIN